MKEADYIVVTDTGSSDHTVEKLLSGGASVIVENVSPWRFDAARNLSLSHVPEQADICVCTDLDEIFEPGWRECLEKAWTPDATQGSYLYNWSLKNDGSPNVQFNYFKVHSRKGFQWQYPVHEVLEYIGEAQEKHVFIPGMVLNHYPDDTKSRGSYLSLLELAVQEMPESDRMHYYLGREYFYKGDWSNCIGTLKDHLRLSSWGDERCSSMRFIAKAYYSLGNIGEASSWYYRAIAEVPDMREPYIEFAQMGYEIGDWALVFFTTGEALKINHKSETYINMGYSWDHTPDDLAAISCYRLGMYDRALQHAREAVRLSPGDERLILNLHDIEEAVKQQSRA